MNKKTSPLVSVIVIDYKENNPYLIECLDSLQKQTYKNFEIILETDHPLKLKYPDLRIIDYKGKYIPPAIKRDHGAKIAKGEIVAFIDDDAFADIHWLENIIPHFKNKSIVGVGGPGITPPYVTWQEAASGWASASPFGSGPYMYRFLAGNIQHTDDFPSMNLSIRRSDFLAVGGYDSKFWPGEDTKLCHDLTQKLNKKIIYEPKAVVFHHRRPIIFPHLKQNGSFGLHRGYFAKILPTTSLRLIYFLPSLMLLGLCFLFLSSFVDVSYINMIRHIGFCILLLYFFFSLINSLWIFSQSGSLLQSIISIPIIFVTHLWYGIKFIQGYLFTSKLRR